MKFRPILEIPRLETTPLASISIGPQRIVVQLDDESERRIALVFAPYQAMRMVTADCYVPPGAMPIIPNTVIEVVGSSWISELRTNLARTDESADFLDQSHHYLIPLQDEFLEIVAWTIAVVPVAE